MDSCGDEFEICDDEEGEDEELELEEPNGFRPPKDIIPAPLLRLCKGKGSRRRSVCGLVSSV